MIHHALDVQLDHGALLVLQAVPIALLVIIHQQLMQHQIFASHV